MIFCEHKWELIANERYASSLAERAKEGWKVNTVGGEALMDTVIQIATCKRCGKIKRWETKV